MNRLNYYNSNTIFNRKALTEVWEILNNYEEGIDNIPEKYLYIIEDNMDKDYIFITDNFDVSKLREETKQILTYLYTNFLSTPEEKQILKKLEEFQYKEKTKKSKTKKLDTQYPIFNKVNLEEKVEFEKVKNKKSKNNLPTKYKESVLKKLLIKIKLFIKNIIKR